MIYVRKQFQEKFTDTLKDLGKKIAKGLSRDFVNMVSKWTVGGQIMSEMFKKLKDYGLLDVDVGKKVGEMLSKYCTKEYLRAILLQARKNGYRIVKESFDIKSKEFQGFLKASETLKKIYNEFASLEEKIENESKSEFSFTYKNVRYDLKTIYLEWLENEIFGSSDNDVKKKVNEEIVKKICAELIEDEVDVSEIIKEKDIKKVSSFLLNNSETYKKFFNENKGNLKVLVELIKAVLEYLKRSGGGKEEVKNIFIKKLEVIKKKVKEGKVNKEFKDFAFKIWEKSKKKRSELFKNKYNPKQFEKTKILEYFKEKKEEMKKVLGEEIFKKKESNNDFMNILIFVYIILLKGR